MIAVRWLCAGLVVALWPVGVRAEDEGPAFTLEGWTTQVLADEFDTRSMRLAGVRSVRGDSFYCFMGPERADLHRPWCLLDLVPGASADAQANPELRIDDAAPRDVSFSKDALPHGNWHTDLSFTLVPGEDLIASLRRGRFLYVVYRQADGIERSVQFTLQGSGAALDDALAPSASE